MLGSQDSASAILPFEKEQVFNAILEVVNQMSGIKIKSSDPLLGRITLSTSVSATSWGESIPIQLTEMDGNKTQISIVSKSKTGVLAGGAFTKKNEQNVELLLNNVSNFLQGKDINIKGGSSKSLLITLILCVFFGWLGAHRYYVGKTKSGLLYTFTFGCLLMGVFIDVFRIMMGNFTDENGDFISNW